MNWQEIWHHRYTGYFLEAVKFGLLLYLSFQVGDRIMALETGGCRGYHSEFSNVEDFSNVEMFSEKQWQEFREKQVQRFKPLNLNQSPENFSHAE